jgi:heat shock protein 90kDa beta
LQAEAAEKELKPLMDFIKSTLGERVERVEVSRRLSDSPVALVTSKFGWTANMERIMKSQVRIQGLGCRVCCSRAA